MLLLEAAEADKYSLWEPIILQTFSLSLDIFNEAERGSARRKRRGELA